MTLQLKSGILICFGILASYGCVERNVDSNFELEPVKIEESAQRVPSPIKSIVKPKGLNSKIVALGDQLFHDQRFSMDNTISCASCHDISKGGVDGKPVSIGVNESMGIFNSPTVFNSSLNFKQFWDGRAHDLFEQAEGPVANPIEMGTSFSEVIEKLKNDKEIVSKFNELFPDGLTKQNILYAIVEFENSLITPSRFDDYLNGDQSAISDRELQGYNLFVDYGCVSCHQGKNVGGNMFQKLGATENYFKSTDELKEADYGRYNVTKKEGDKFYFKVPSLRNVELTAPYFHDGSINTLEEAIQIMARFQAGRNIPDDEIQLIIEFLKSLTGKELSK